MKNFTRILVAGVLVVPFMGSAQTYVNTSPENRNAVVEEFTGIHCGYCPIGHETVQSQMAANPGDVVAINYHAGSYAVPGAGEPDFRTPEGDVFDGAMGITGYPASTLNRRTISGETDYHPGNLDGAAYIPTVLGETSEVNLWSDATIDVQTGQLSVDVEYYYTSNAPSATNYLYVALVQNNIAGPQTDYGNYNPSGWQDQAAGIYNHMEVFRQYLTGQWGQAINSTTMGSTAMQNFTLTIPASYTGVATDLSNMELVIFINDGNQNAGDVLTGINVYPTLTNFPSTDEVVYVGASLPQIQACNPGGTETASPEITIQNWGSNAMTQLDITYDMNGGTAQNQAWTGNLAPGASTTVTLNPITWTVNGSDVLNVTLANPNGVADNAADNSGSYNLDIMLADPTNMYVTVDLHTDNYADEIWMEITNSGGTIVWSEGNENVQGNYDTGTFPPPADPTNPLVNDTDYSWQANLPALDFYTFTIYDYYGDGLSVGGTGAGYDVRDNTGSLLFSEGALNFGGMEVGGLIANQSVGVAENSLENLSVYPNPATNVLHVNFDGEGAYTVEIMDLQGRVIASEAGTDVTFSVTEFASGSYMVRISNENTVYTENVVIK